MNFDIKTHVRGPATFQYFRDSALWYETCAGMLFPVPLSDIGTTTFNATEKGLMMMRWIRKHIDSIKAAKHDLDVLTRGDLV